MDISLEQIRHGTNEPHVAPVELRAGRLMLVLDSGDLRCIRYTETEVVRRVYIAVRDHHWNNVPARITNLHIHRDEDSFAVTYNAAYRQGAIDFRCRITIEGGSDNRVSYTMDGEAHTTFLRNRIGICVHHPVAECAGHTCLVEHTDDTVEQGSFPSYIAPHQPFLNIRAIKHEVASGVQAELRFDGDVFEMEDQRNWTDASFKTYSTPLALPFPFEVKQGTRIKQKFTLHLDGDARITRPRTRGDETRTDFFIGKAPTTRVPRIGLGVARHGEPLSEIETERLRALNLAHLRVDLALSHTDCEDVLRQASEEARALETNLEVALTLTDLAAAELDHLRDLLAKHKPTVQTWLVFHCSEKVTSEQWIRQAREYLQGYDPTSKFSGGTNNYFTELNRERPPLAAVDCIVYSCNPQVHAFDDLSLIENLPAQAATITSARQFIGDLPLMISPVTLKPHFNPHAPPDDAHPQSDKLPSSVDARQMSLFGAAWTAGSLKYIAESSVESVTYYETCGWRGVMERASGSLMPDCFPSLPSAVFPLYHVLADIGEFASGDMVYATSSAPRKIDGFAVHKSGKARILLANMTSAHQQITVSDLSGPVNIRRLNEMNAREAMFSPDEFRRRAPHALKSRNNVLKIDLLPYEIVTIDSARE
ncbi:MAG: hypothetical protein M3458_04475 [Acidobacteriota bacterium]|nr:hypothetical protein [Acidobacteriota bacterium]